MLKFVCGYFYWLEINFAKKNPALLSQKLVGYSKTKKKK